MNTKARRTRRTVWMAIVWLILGLCMKGVAGWRCDGVAKPEADVPAVVAENSAAIAELQSAKVDKAASIAMPMEDAAGTETTWNEWAVGGTTNVTGNWRLGVVSSNFVIQARGSGGWTNAVEILKP